MIEIGGRTFESVVGVREYIYHILHNAPFDEPLTGTDANLIHELFLCHPDAEEKLDGKDVLHFIVGKHPQAGARAFCIVREDGLEETFSIKKCVGAWTKKIPTNMQSSKPTSQSRGSGKTSGLQDTLQRVIALHTELGKEIVKIQKLIADESMK